MSFAKKSSGTVTGDSGKGSGSTSTDSPTTTPKKQDLASSGGGTNECAGCPPKPSDGPHRAPTPDETHCSGGCCDGAADCQAPPTPPTPKNPHENEEGVGCDPTGKICDDGQDHSHDGFRGGCFHFGTQVTCGVCRGPNDLVSTNCGHPRTIIKTQVTQVPVATVGLTSAQAASLSARIAQLQSLMTKPYDAECKSQIQHSWT
jgi:hypothetical protein